MIGFFADDASEPIREESLAQLRAVRLAIANTVTARARVEFERTRPPRRWGIGRKEGRAADEPAEFAQQAQSLDRLEQALREREARLTRRIRGLEGTTD